MIQMFSFEIQSQNYKRIIQDYDVLPIYKQALNSVSSASRQNALWGAVTDILKGTVEEVWSKDYAKQVFEEAKAHPEVAELIENIKAKIREKVDIEQLMDLYEAGMDLYDDIKYMTGRSVPSEKHMFSAPIKALEYVTTVLPDGQLTVPAEVIKSLNLKTISKVRVLILNEEE